jgi:hypothetical protein
MEDDGQGLKCLHLASPHGSHCARYCLWSAYVTELLGPQGLGLQPGPFDNSTLNARGSSSGDGGGSGGGAGPSNSTTHNHYVTIGARQYY